MTELQIHRFCLGDNENMTLRGRLALRTGPGKGPAPTITWGAEDADTWETRPCPPPLPHPRKRTLSQGREAQGARGDERRPFEARQRVGMPTPRREASGQETPWSRRVKD